MVSTFHWFFTLNYTDIMMKYKIIKYNIIHYSMNQYSFYKIFYFMCLIVLMFNHNNILYILEYFH